MDNCVDNFKPPPPLSFDGNVSDNWNLWRQQFEIYLRVIKSDSESDEKHKVAMFLNYVGLEGLILFNSFNLNSETATLEDVLAAFESHCVPPPANNIVLERFKFLGIRRRDAQTFDQYLAEMKNAAARCGYSETDNMIRDQIIFHLEDHTLRERLLQTPALTLEETIKRCREVESWSHWPTASIPPTKERDDASNHPQGTKNSSVRTLSSYVQRNQSTWTTNMTSNVLDEVGYNQSPQRSYRDLPTFGEEGDWPEWNDTEVTEIMEGKREAGRKLAQVQIQPSSSCELSDSDIEELTPPPRPAPILISIDTSESESEPENKRLKNMEEEN